LFGIYSRLLLFTAVSIPALQPNHLPIQWVAGDLSPGVKGPEREADHYLFISICFQN